MERFLPKNETYAELRGRLCWRSLSLLSTLSLLAACSLSAPSQGRSLSAPVVQVAQTASSQDVARRGRAVLRSSLRRVAERRLHGWVMPLSSRYHPRIATRSHGSVAVGTVTTGYLVDAAEMPLVGPHHAILERLVERNMRFTTDEMKSLLLCVAERVAKAHPDHRLYLGNMSRRGGGDIPWSVSHNNGRDADIAFLSRRPDGTAARPDHLYPYGRSLEARNANEPMIFDVAANWTLVKSLLTCPGPGIDKLFIARWLRYSVLRYARAIKEPRELIYRAASLLRQPRHSSAHSDHLHLRIACPEDDRSEGCLRRSRAPEVAIGQGKRVRRRLPELRKVLAKSDDPERRSGAAYLLGLYHDSRAVSELKRALSDRWPEVRLRAVEALTRVLGSEASGVLSDALDRELTPQVALAELRALDRLGAIEALAARLRDPRVLVGDNASLPDVIVRQVALELLEESRSLAAASLVVPLLADVSPSVRLQAHRTLGRIVNRGTSDLVLQFAAEDAREDARVGRAFHVHWPQTPTDYVALWSRFIASLPADADRDAVVLAGFQQRGLPLDELDRGSLSYLASALSWENPYRENAARYISQIVEYEPEIGRSSRASPAHFWLPWLTRRHLIDRQLVRLVQSFRHDLVQASAPPTVKQTQ